MGGVSVLLVTYRAPAWLELVLCGLARQVQPPDEILVAEDDEEPETAAVVERWSGRLPLVHLTQEHDGFGKPRILNEAAARSRGDHLVFLDGDAIPHRLWVRDHAKAQNGRRVLIGRRVHLGPGITRALTPEQVLAGELESLVGPVARAALRGDVHRFRMGIRLPQGLARWMHSFRWRGLMGVNFSLPRHLFEAVNGFDEDTDGARREDLSLELRLRRLGAPFYPLIHRAVVYHLHHPVHVYDHNTRRFVEELERSGSARCEHGLDAHLSRSASPRD